MSVADDRRLWGKGGIYHVLLASLLLLMALQPFAELAGGLLLRFALAGLLFASIATAAYRRRLLIVSLVLGIPAVGFLFVPGRVPTVAGGFLAIATLVFICFVILRRIFKHPVVTSATVSASLVVYLAFGVVWAEAYRLVEHFHAGSFTGLSGTGVIDVRRDLYYYSYVTLTTMGYGDIEPVSPEARSLAITEAVVGQLFLAVLVASLVGMHLAQRQSAADA
ncbi:MAG: ion channel [Longimicrobiales bacterium]